MLYVCEVDDVKLETINALENLLDSDRKSKMAKYRFQKDRTLCIVSFALLRFALWEEYGVGYVPKLYTNTYGKPYFQDVGLSFNLSHCDSAVACALDSQAVGVDVQDYSQNVKFLLDRVLTPCEVERASNMKEVTRIWTIKEAYGKYHGWGLNYPFSSKDFSSVSGAYGWQTFESLSVMSCQFEKYSLSAFTAKPMSVRFVSMGDLLSLKESVVALS